MDETGTWLFFADFVRLYISHHAARNSVSALELADELNHHGYRFNVGKLNRVLTSLEQAGYLTAAAGPASGTWPKRYDATTEGRDFIVVGKAKLQELAEEILPSWPQAWEGRTEEGAS
jgi:DNA-binding PadR family transcriptional regulator